MIQEVCIALVVLLFCLLFKWQYSYWARNKIEGPSPFPLFGNMFEYVTYRKHYATVYDEIYNSFPKASFIGIFKMSSPAVIVRDLDLVKTVMAGDFSSFHDNDFIVNEKLDPLLAQNPFIAGGDAWKSSRARVSPIFSHGKVKMVFPCIKSVCGEFVKYIEDKIENDKNEFEAKDICSRYTIENVASCAFGIEGGCFKEENSQFSVMARDIFNPTFTNYIKQMIALFIPSMTKVMKISFLSSSVDIWLRNIVLKVVQMRSEKNLQRNDFIQTLIELKEKLGEEFTEDLLIGNSLMFVTEGFETSSTLMTYCLYELAKNPEIQEKLQKEIEEVWKKNNGELTEEGVQELTYMDKVMYETVRLHSVVFAITRLCTKDYELPPQYSESMQRVTIKKGTSVIVPVYSIHKDPEYYPEPHIFDPERFNEDNKKLRDRYAFLGFGEGPRICLGIKFGLTQSKAAIATLLAKYTIKLSPKTIEPLTFSKKAFVLTSENGIYLNFEKRVSK